MKDLSIRNFTLPFYCLVFSDVCTVFYLLKESNTFRVVFPPAPKKGHGKVSRKRAL